MWRKARLSGTEGLDHVNGEGERVGEGEDVEEWMERTQETMNTLRTGEIYAQPNTCYCKEVYL